MLLTLYITKRMKKLFTRTMLLLCALIAGSGTVWADDESTNVTIKFGTGEGCWAAHTSGSFTDSDSREWSCTYTAGGKSSGQTTYSQFGNSSNTCTSLVLTATAGSDFTLTTFSVKMAGASGSSSPTKGTVYLYKTTSTGVETQLATATINGTTDVICSIAANQDFSSTDILKVSYVGTAKAIRIYEMSYSYISGDFVLAPTFSPAGGTYMEEQSVAINSATTGTSIYYTTDGSTPSVSSNAYSSAIAVSKNTTIKAVAVKGNVISNVAEAAYELKVAKPVISPNGTSFDEYQEVAITCATGGATIYYTLDGTEPTSSSNEYTGSISVSDSKTVKAIAIKEGWTASEIAEAAFTKAVMHTISWSVNGTIVKTEKVAEGTAINFETPTMGIPAGYTFTGWVTEENRIETPTDTEPKENYLTAMTCTAPVTFYAVLAAGNLSSGTATLTANSSWSGYADKTFTDDKNNTWTAKCAGQNNSGTYVIGLNSTNDSYVESPEFDGKITKITMYGWNGSSSATRTFYINSSKDVNTGDLGTISVAPSEKATTKLTATLSSQSFSKFYLGVSAALSFKSISVTYQKASYSGFCTTIPSTTITLNAACNDGGIIYGTYYTDRAYVMHDDLYGSVVSVDNEGALTVDEVYSGGSVVPANTALLISTADEFTGTKDYTITYTIEEGDDYSEFNMLKGTLTADEMTEGENCLFYRLTMHNGETIGFWWGAEEGGAFKPGANKAYLAVPTTQDARMGFAFGDEATGIEAAQTSSSEASNEVYNLQGQRVKKAQKGLYIVNGKKFINK